MRRPALAALVRAARRGGVARSTRHLLADVARLELRSVVHRLTAHARPILDTGRWRLPDADVRVVGSRRVVVHGQLTQSLDAQCQADALDLGHALLERGLTAFTVRHPGGTEVWVDGTAREATVSAVRAICTPTTNGFSDASADSPLPRVQRHHGLGTRRTLATAVDVRHGRPESGGDAPAPIDFVVTWVDPDTDGWRESFTAVAEAVGMSDDVAGHRSRYDTHDELRFALRSVWLYCGWFHRIHLVTAGERPAWLRAHERLTVVEHATFMPEDGLPTFNSHAIEARLHHIPDLAERFVYVNDDFFVGRPTQPATFFANDLDDPIVAPLSGPLPDDETTTGGQLRAAQLTSRLLMARSGFPDTRLLHHAPYSNRVSRLHELEATFPEEFAQTARRRFRNPDDVSVPASLGPWASVADGKGVVGSHTTEYVSLGHPTTRLRLRRIAREAPTFWCANRTEQTPAGAHADVVERTLRRLYPEAAPWEI